jgi:hypothetical protein
MPNITFEQIIPPYPLHWTTIIHYVYLLATIALLAIGGERTSLLFTLLLSLMALATGVDLYSNLIQFPRFFVFIDRVLMLGLPIIIVGMTSEDFARVIGIVNAAIGLVLVVLVFFTCSLGPGFGDPRVWAWC